MTGRPQQRRIDQRAGDRQDRDRSEVAEVVCLHHESGSGFALIALQGDRHQVPTRHAVQPVVPDAS